MIKEVSEQYDIDKVYADKAHDNRRSFNLLDNLNIEPAIQILLLTLCSSMKSCTYWFIMWRKRSYT